MYDTNICIHVSIYKGENISRVGSGEVVHPNPNRVGSKKSMFGGFMSRNNLAGSGRDSGSGIYVCIYVYICIYMCMYLCMYICIYVYIFM
jgi:hypothetical protein